MTLIKIIHLLHIFRYVFTISQESKASKYVFKQFNRSYFVVKIVLPNGELSKYIGAFYIYLSNMLVIFFLFLKSTNIIMRFFWIYFVFLVLSNVSFFQWEK